MRVLNVTLEDGSIWGPFEQLASETVNEAQVEPDQGEFNLSKKFLRISR